MSGGQGTPGWLATLQRQRQLVSTLKTIASVRKAAANYQLSLAHSTTDLDKAKQVLCKQLDELINTELEKRPRRGLLKGSGLRRSSIATTTSSRRSSVSSAAPSLHASAAAASEGGACKGAVGGQGGEELSATPKALPTSSTSYCDALVGALTPSPDAVPSPQAATVTEMGGGAPAPQPDSSAGQELAAALQRNLLHEMQIISLHNELTAVKHENVKLWAALQRAGIGGTMLQAIQAMYADVPVCVRTEEGLSGCFQSVLGVKQGCPLSPLLFGIFLDDFEGHIQQLGDAAALPQLAGRTVPPLLFADDMFLLSSSASGLQAQLHALQDYCNAKKLTVNAKKTQVMIMRPGGGSGNGKLAAGESFEYAGLPLEVASSTKYLGLTFSQLSKQHGFASCADVLAKAGRQAMFAMRRRAWELGACLVEQQCMLFDVFVKPVLSYGCELWGVDVLLRPDCSSVERVHRWFCRRVQGLPKQVTAAISLAELGRQPLQSFWIQQLVRFWNRLQNSAADEDRVLGHPRMAH
ncbi:hypothetical protein D9Q98_010481 [Chlorella vulgaris]|uniref:Reverse transcriptase domain-containing protein n=1 Tax=Chlorella vulgaris TaxID=3077 RepID=A0A9D4TS05_CHLVU|nr:hypothetical protein D9Q98_010481 [Chlorella vulgaris]